MIQIIVKNNIKEFTRWMDEVQYKQVPFATSRALNDTAIDAQNAIVKNVETTFKNRKKWWLKQQPTGIKVQFSNKNKLRSSVFTDVYFAKIQEEGGNKTPTRGKNLAIPTDRVPKRYRTSHGAKDMMNEGKRVFRTPKGVFKRTGKKTIQAMWTFARTAIVKPRFKFMATAETTARKMFDQRFSERFAQAMQSAKK